MSGSSAVPILRSLFDDGQPFVACSGRLAENGQKVWVNKLFNRLDQAERWLASRSRTRHNVYIKHASFNGELHPKGSPKCELPYVVGSRSFFIDLDFGVGKSYASAAEALQSLRDTFQAMRALRIPPPTMLQLSGHGVQGVWSCSRVFNIGEWRVLNGVLYSLLQEYGLKLDPLVMAAERSVRVCGPDFFNYKPGPVDNSGPASTQLIYNKPRIPAEVMTQALMPHRVRVVADPTLAAGLKEYAVPGGAAFEFHISDVVAHCEVLKDADATQGKDHDFGLWSDIIGQCAKDSDEGQGDQWAHWFSSGHADYDADEVDKKLYSYRTSGSKGYVTCARFKTTFKAACERCRFKDRVNSAAGIPKVLRELQDNPEELPGGTYVNRPGGLTRLSRDGDVVVWTNRHVGEVELYEDADNHAVKLGFVVSYSDTAHRKGVLLGMGDLATSKQLQAAMAGFNMPMTNNDALGVHRAMTAWVTRLQQQRAMKRTYSRLGWVGGDAAEFVLGANVYGVHGVASFTSLDPELEHFVASGTLTSCQGIEARCGVEQRPEMHALLAASYGAPLIELCGGLDGFALNFWSARSGYGKTLGAKRGASVWGYYKALMLGGTDTFNAAMGKLGRLHSLPAYFDDPDPTGIDPTKQFRSLIYSAARGVEKQRLTSDAKPQAHGTWRTFLVFLSNQRFSGMIDNEKLKGDATAARFLDFEVGPLPDRAYENATEFMALGSQLDVNYGQLGAAYIQHVVRHRAEIVLRLAAVTKVLMPLTAVRPNDVSGRMQAAAGACLIVAAHLCQTTGLAPLDAQKVALAVKLALHNACKARAVGQNRVSPFAMVKTFCHDKAASRVLTTRQSGRTYLVNEHPTVALPVAYEVDRTAGAKTAWISVEELRSYVIKQGISFLTLLDTLQQLQLIDPVRRSLAPGTAYATSRQVVVRLPLADPRWSDLDV